jgi:hypothetical protein
MPDAVRRARRPRNPPTRLRALSELACKLDFAGPILG